VPLRIALRVVFVAAALDAEPNLSHPLRTPMPDPKTAHDLQIVARGMGRLGRERARGGGDLTPQQAEALQLIADRAVLSTSSLAVLLGIDPSTASRNLAGLERGGYVLRRRGIEDGRQTNIRISPRGRRATETASKEWLATYVSLLERVPRGERQCVVDALAVLARVFESGNEGRSRT
jgi:DNA-binding MarR family transcriptional regulator